VAQSPQWQPERYRALLRFKVRQLQLDMLAQSSNPAEKEDRFEEVILSYLQAADAGQTPQPELLLARHPELTEELKRFFADQSRLYPFLGPLKALAPTSPDVELRSFGDYEVLEKMAHGGMGVVWKARQLSLNRLVALKMIRNRQLADAGDVQRFRTEAENAARLDHPHIVPIYEVGEWRPDRDSPPVPFFCMKLIEGGSLAGHLTSFRNDPAAAVRLLIPVARAIQHAHQHAILHRDLKPSNILLDAAGRPHVTDFGLARRLDTDSDLTTSGAIVGTPSYMAPEQSAGAKRTLTTATDVYGLGAILYALLTGQPPFKGDTPLDTVKLVVEKEPEPPRRLNPHVDRDLETICLKCLEKEPSRRYGSAEALAEDLDRYLDGKTILARPVRWWERVWKWARRRPAAAALCAVSTLALAALITGGVLYERWLQDALNQAETNAETARRQGQRSEASYRAAREALDRCVKTVADDPRLQRGALEDLRRAVREAEKAFYETFVDLQGDDPSFQVDRIMAYQQLAFVSQELGSKEEALAHYRKALAIATQLVAEHPGVPEYQSKLWLGWNNVGEMCRQMGRVEEAEQCLLKAVALGKDILRDHAGVAAHQVGLGRSQNNLGLLYCQTQRPKEAWRTFTAALSLLNEANNSDPTGTDNLPELARTELNFGLLFAQHWHQPRAALQPFEDGLAHYRVLVRQHPKSTERRSELALTLTNLGGCYWETRQVQKAEQALKEAIALWSALTQERPLVVEYRNMLAGTYKTLGLLKGSSKK